MSFTENGTIPSNQDQHTELDVNFISGRALTVDIWWPFSIVNLCFATVLRSKTDSIRRVLRERRRQQISLPQCHGLVLPSGGNFHEIIYGGETSVGRGR